MRSSRVYAALFALLLLAGATGCVSTSTAASLPFECRPVMLGPVDRVGGSPSAYAPTSSATALKWSEVTGFSSKGSQAPPVHESPDQVPLLALSLDDDLGVRVADLRADAGNFYVIMVIAIPLFFTIYVDGGIAGAEWTTVEADAGPTGR